MAESVSGVRVLWNPSNRVFAMKGYGLIRPPAFFAQQLPDVVVDGVLRYSFLLFTISQPIAFAVMDLN
jgi:hypothetical protein